MIKESSKRRQSIDYCAVRNQPQTKAVTCAPRASPTAASLPNDTEEALIQRHVQLLKVLLERVTAQRAMQKLYFSTVSKKDDGHLEKPLVRCDVMVADEITEVVEVLNSEDFSLQSTDDGSESPFSDSSEDELASSSLSPQVQAQLKLFVERIASCYHAENPFHNFMHASHVTFSCYQMLRKVAARDLPPIPLVDCPASDAWSNLPRSACDSAVAKALGGDALAQFAIIFSALIHDVDHEGVPNFLLAKEKPEAAKKYKNRSIAEQTSLDVAWALLEQASFHELRACIFPSAQDYFRFRAIVVNIVMATDAFDATLKDFQDQKWAKAFDSPPHCAMEQRNRKATVMMDLIMKASDISHTMQSFEVYCEWNERLYRETYAAYREGRSEKDPSDGWVTGELIFFDKHIIPLAKRLQESGTFGATADAIVHNAQNNRKEWERRGKRIFQDLQARVKVSSECDDLGPARKKAKLTSFPKSA